MDEQMIELIARAIFEAHNATYTVGGPAKWESDPEHWRRYARAAHSVIAGKVAELTDIVADLECALVMAREHSPTATVTSFVDSSIQFKRLADYLHAQQHVAALAPYPERRHE